MVKKAKYQNGTGRYMREYIYLQRLLDGYSTKYSMDTRMTLFILSNDVYRAVQKGGITKEKAEEYRRELEILLGVHRKGVKYRKSLFTRIDKLAGDKGKEKELEEYMDSVIAYVYENAIGRGKYLYNRKELLNYLLRVLEEREKVELGYSTGIIMRIEKVKTKEKSKTMVHYKIELYLPSGAYIRGVDTRKRGLGVKQEVVKRDIEASIERVERNA